jgi:transcriptional regulator
MYSPTYNHIRDRAEALAFMRANNFAVLVAGDGAGEHALTASHLPVLIEERPAVGGEGLVIVGHLAKSNPQWEQFFDQEVMVVFQGAHAYISPRWYAQTERVPTWNYAAVHAYGQVRGLTDREEKYDAVAKLVAAHDPVWLSAFQSLSTTYMDGMLQAIVAFEINVTHLETRWKLSQNRGRDEQLRIAAALDQSQDASARSLAALTRAHLVKD